MFSSIRLRPAALVVTAILIALTFFLVRRPYYNWDMFPYMAVIMEQPDVPFARVHGDVYGEAAIYLPPQDFLAISARQPELAKDPHAFHSILRYYTIKPGYTYFAELFFAMGVHPVLATVLPSLIGYFALGIILFFWSQSVGNPGSALLLTLLVALSPPMMDLARYSSPDMMCAAFSVAALALILTARLFAGICILYLTIWIRPDAILLLVPVTLALAGTRIIRWDFAAVVLLASFASVWVIVGISLFREYVEVSPGASRWDWYLEGLKAPSAYFILFLAIGAVQLYLNRRAGLSTRTLLLWACLVSLLARYILHPVIEDRFNLPAYFLILMIGWEAVMTRRKQVGS